MSRATIINELMDKIDRASDTLHDGLVSEALGRRSAVILFVLLEGSSSMQLLFWIGVGLLATVAPEYFSIPAVILYLLCASLMVVGLCGFWIDLKIMAARPVVDRARTLNKR